MPRPRKDNALDSLDRMIGKDRSLRALIDEEVFNAEVASLIYRARAHAGLTQAQLARLIGTTQPTIARLEDADYSGHSLTMLRRIAAALSRRVELRFVPLRRRPRAA